jgi:drug/metabolite transporter (DMT)-like permease
MKLSNENERWFWILGAAAAGTCFAFSHTFYVTTQTFVLGGCLAAISCALLLFKIATRSPNKPKSVRWTSNVVLITVAAMFVLYMLGVLTYYE